MDAAEPLWHEVRLEFQQGRGSSRHAQQLLVKLIHQLQELRAAGRSDDLPVLVYER